MSNYRLVAVITVTILLAISILSLYTPISEAQSSPIKIKWRVHSNPTPSTDVAYGVCEFGDYIYVVGEEGGKDRVEKRFKSNGALVKSWSGHFGPSAPLRDCTVIDEKLYAVNFGSHIFVFDLDLNIQVTGKDTYYPRGYAFSIISYGDYLYIAGAKYREEGGAVWSVEKWSAKDLSLVKSYSSDATTRFALSIGVNPVTKQLWVVGEFVGELGYNEFRVEILDLDLNLVKIIKRAGWSSALSITFDEDGYAYIGGSGFVPPKYDVHGLIAKYDKLGNEIAAVEMRGPAYKILYVNNYTYVGSEELIDNYNRQVLYIFDKNLNQVDKIVLSRDMNTSAMLNWGKMAFDGKNLYIAGGDGLIDWGWTIYAISILLEELGTTTQTAETISPPITLTNATQATTIDTPAVTLNITKPSTPSKDDMTTLTLIVIVFAIAVITVAAAVILVIRK